MLTCFLSTYVCHHITCTEIVFVNKNSSAYEHYFAICDIGSKYLVEQSITSYNFQSSVIAHFVRGPYEASDLDLKGTPL